MTRIGASSLVSPRRIARLGSFYVAQSRLLQMWKWRGAIISYGLGNPLLYLASIGVGLGTMIDARSNSGIDGVSYLVFLAPSLLAAAAINGALEETCWPTLEGFIWGKQFYAMHATALTPAHIVWGVMWSSLVRTVLTVLLYWAVLFGFGAVSLGTAVALLAVSIFAGSSFALFMLAVTANVKNDDAFMAVFYRFVLTPMFLFSGTFYPLTSLSLAVQWVGWISPLWHATEIARWVSYGHEVSPTMLVVHFGFLTAMFITGAWIGIRTYTRRLVQ